MGFDIRLKDDGVPVEDAEFMIFGKAVNMMEKQGEQMDMAIDQQKQQMEQMEQQQQMMEQQAQAGQQPGQPPAAPEGVNMAPGRTGSAPGGGESQEAQPMPPMPMQMMQFAPLKGGENKDYLYNGMGSPHPKKERDAEDLDKYADARKDAFDPTKTPKNWIEGVIAKGYLTPLIKQVADDGSKMWFTQDGVDYIANLHPTGVTHVEKASFGMGPVYKTPHTPAAKYNTTSDSESREHDLYEEDANVSN